MSQQGEESASATVDTSDWITGSEVARMLGVSRRKVFRMVDRGELEIRGRYVHRNFRRAAVEAALARGESMSLSVAARILGRPVTFVLELIASGELTSFGNPKWPVFRVEVEAYAQAHPVPPWVRSRPAGREGQLNSKEAASVLGLGVDRVKQLARSGRLPVDKDTQGRYWFRREHLALYLRARAAEAAAERFESLPAAST